MQRTLVIIKPDGVARGLDEEILGRFKRANLKMLVSKKAQMDKAFMAKHYGGAEEWLKGMGNKTLENYEKFGLDAVKELGTADALAIGKMIYDWLTTWMASGPVVAAVFEGNQAVEIAKKLAGHTIPLFAAPGTIRGDYSSESADLANGEKRPIQNLVHISGNLEDAAREIQHWFPELK